MTAQARQKFKWSTSHLPISASKWSRTWTAKFEACETLVESRGSFGGINGGYFEANLDPIGLLISNDRVVHPTRKAKLFSGIFFVRNGQPELARTSEFSGTRGVQQAIQCGPFLVDGGRTVDGLNYLRVAPRTFIFTCGPTMWGFGICRSVTLKEMGDILAHANVVPEHRIIRALNFDGGSSTALYLRPDGRTIFSEGRSVVSNYLVVQAKTLARNSHERKIRNASPQIFN